jgi:hypothetical protein
MAGPVRLTFTTDGNMSTLTTARLRTEKRATALGHYWRSPSPPGQLRRHLRDSAGTFFKEASIGGEQEAGFEQAFSSLAYAYLKDKAPRLIDFVIGFQLVDRNEDNTKAMGVFGFKVGDQWLYAPVFFLNGDLKGHELLYVKRQDAFVPMKENWVNHLISRKPHILGEATPKDTFQLGGVPPDLFRMTHPPGSSKYGADAYRPVVQEWAKPFLTFVGAAATRSDKVFAKQAGLARRLDLGGFLRQDFGLLKGAWDLTQRYPLLKSGFEKFYGRDFFVAAARDVKLDHSSILKRAAAPPPRDKSASLIADPPAWVHPLRSGSLRVRTFDYDDLARPRGDSLIKSADTEIDEDAPGGGVGREGQPDQEDQEELLRGGVVIDDDRRDEDKSVVYDTQVRLELTNPGDTGIYDVLEKPGTFDEMLVIFHPQTNRGRESYCTVVRLSDPRNWLNIHSSNLWVRASPLPERDDFKKWFDKQDEGKDLDKGGYYLAVGPNGAGTTPFRVRQSYEDDNYQVEFKDYAQYGRDKPTWMRGKGYYHGVDPISDGYDYVSTYDGKLFFNKKEGSSLRSVQGELSVPANFKVLKLKDPPPPPKKDNGLLEAPSFCCSPEDGGRETGSEERPIQPGDLVDVQLMIHEKTAALRIIDQGGSVWVKSRGGADVRMTKRAALTSLVCDHGCTERDARAMLDRAGREGRGSWRIKYAEGPNRSVLDGGPGAPPMPGPLVGAEQVGYGAVPSIYPQEEFRVIPDLSASRTDTRIYDPFYQPDQQAMQMAQEAANSGQKEVFDTAMIGGMLKSVRQDSLVDKHLGDLMKALDKLGRILFMFYWHQEEFEDRYGKQDLPELEDSLRNAFEVLGDVVLFLKEKSVGGLDQFGGGASTGNQAEPSVQEAARN